MFTTIELVKDLDGGFKTDKSDKTLQLIVDGVNSKIIDLLSRHLIVGDYTDNFDIQPTTSITYSLKGYPVESVSEVRVDGEVLSDNYYRVNLKTGTLQMLIEPPFGVSMLEVDYRGGMAANETELRENFNTIVYEATLQALFEFKRREKLTSSSISMEKGASQSFIPFEIRKEARRAIRPYRRRSLIG